MCFVFILFSLVRQLLYYGYSELDVFFFGSVKSAFLSQIVCGVCLTQRFFSFPSSHIAVRRLNIINIRTLKNRAVIFRFKVKIYESSINKPGKVFGLVRRFYEKLIILNWPKITKSVENLLCKFVSFILSLLLIKTTITSKRSKKKEKLQIHSKVIKMFCLSTMLMVIIFFIELLISVWLMIIFI